MYNFYHDILIEKIKISFCVKAKHIIHFLSLPFERLLSVNSDDEKKITLI